MPVNTIAGRLGAISQEARFAVEHTRFGSGLDQLFAWGNGSRKRAKWTLFLGLVAIFAILFGKNIVFSLRRGRLSASPGYDDITYLLDGLRRLVLLRADGWVALWENGLALPPRAPFSTILAMTGFAWFGPEPVSAYLMNGFILAAYILVVAYLSRPLGNVTERLFLVALFTIVPAVRAMVTEFRPDMAAGFAFGVAVLAICSTQFATASIRRRLAIAALGVVATVIKPSGAVVTVPGLGIALLAAVGVQIWIGDVGWKTALGRALLPIFGYIVLLSPFALILGPPAVAYIYQTLVTTKEIWSAHAGALFHATYHILGVGGFKGLGAFAIIGLVIVAMDIRRLHRAPASREKTSAISLYLFLLVLYCAMATSSEKTAYQGSFFYFPFILAVIKADVRVLIAFRSEGLQKVGRATLVGTFAALMLFWPLGQGYTRIEDIAPDQLRLLETVSERIAATSESLGGASLCSGRPLALLATNSGPIPPESIVFRAMGKGAILDFDGTTWATRLDEVVPKADRSDFIMVSDPKTGYLDRRMPGYTVLPQILDHLKADPAWRQEEVGLVGGKPTWLFIRTACTPWA